MPTAKKPVVVSNPVFKWAVIVNAIVCFATFSTMIILAAYAPDPMNKAQESLSAACEKVFFMTTGAFLGLLGGRAGSPNGFRPA